LALLSSINHNPYLLLILGIKILIISSCSNIRYLKSHENLIVNYTINVKTKVNAEQKYDIKEQLYLLCRPKPNRTMLSIGPIRFGRIRLLKYNIHNKSNNDNGYHYWWRTKFGEAPVLLDSSLINMSMQSMQNFLFNKGYFDASITYDVKIRKQKANIIFNIETNEPYRIEKVIWPEANSLLLKYINGYKSNCLIKEGSVFDADIISKERNRITSMLRNNGYFKFNKELLYFDADSSINNNKVNLYIRIQEMPDSSLYLRYRIHDIGIHTDYSFTETNDKDKDTTFYRDKIYVYTYHNFKEKALADRIFVTPNTYFDQSKIDLTLNRIGELPVIKFSTIRYESASMGVLDTPMINVILFLSQTKKKEYQIELESTSNAENTFGSAGNLSFKHKNIFRGAQVFNINQRVGAEWVIDNFKKLSLNTLDINTQLDLFFPKFALPFEIKTAGVNNPRTLLSLRNNHQYRIGYFRMNTTSASFGYTWHETNTKLHIFNPISINYTQLFEVGFNLPNLLSTNPGLARSFAEQFIVGTSYRYTYNDQFDIIKRKGTYINGNIELVGNLLSLSNLVNENQNNTGQYLIFDRPYSQYIRLELDARRYYGINRLSQFVLRGYYGLGVPYGNSGKSLPIIKQFFSGGNSSLRAFRIRSIGPGSYNSPQDPTTSSNFLFLDQIGDMKLEANAEFRFDIFKWFKGAAFVDVGNIWLLNKDTTKLNGEFRFDRFYKELAIGSGLGIRLDFSYFILRLDLGVPVRQPSLPEGNRMVISWNNLGDRQWRQKNMILNLAIGYPF